MISVMQQLLFAAQDANMTNNDYAWFTFYAPTNVTSTVTPWTAFNMSGQDADYRKQAFYAVKQVFSRHILCNRQHFLLKRYNCVLSNLAYFLAVITFCLGN
jgi:hypothetical protein